MKYCDYCHVEVESRRSTCPLCGEELSGDKTQWELDFPENPVEQDRRLKTRYLTALTVVVAAVCLVSALVVTRLTQWLAIAALGVLYLALSIHFVRRSRRNMGLLSLIQVFGLSLVAFLVDFATGYDHWSTSYVIPFVIISAAVLMSVVLVLRPRRFRDYILYQLGISIIGIGVSVYIILDQNSVTWTGIVGAAYSGLTILGILLFTARKTKHELKKRLHF